LGFVAVDLAGQIAAVLVVGDRDVGNGPKPRKDCVSDDGDLREPLI